VTAFCGFAEMAGLMQRDDVAQFRKRHGDEYR
jgi:hypothetical protein